MLSRFPTCPTFPQVPAYLLRPFSPPEDPWGLFRDSANNTQWKNTRSPFTSLAFSAHTQSADPSARIAYRGKQRRQNSSGFVTATAAAASFHAFITMLAPQPSLSYLLRAHFFFSLSLLASTLHRFLPAIAAGPKACVGGFWVFSFSFVH